MDKTIAQYISIRNKIEDHKARIKLLEEQKAQIESTLIEYLDQNPVGSLVGEGGEKLYRGTRRYAKVPDERAFENWAVTEGEQIIGNIWTKLQESYNTKNVKPELLEQRPNMRLLNVLIRYFADMAEREGEYFRDLLPPGVDVTVTEYIAMRRPSGKQKSRQEFETQAESLLRMIKDGAKDE